MLEHGAQVGPDGDPALLQVLGVAEVLDRNYGAFECWTTRHLENFVNVVAGGVPAGD